MKKKVLLMAAQLLAVFILAEIILRWAPTSYRKAIEHDLYIRDRSAVQDDFCEADPDPSVRWINIPEKSGPFINREFNTTIHINSWGFRGPEMMAARADEKTVLILGDSFGFGWGVNDPESFVQKMATVMPGARFINASVPGYGTEQEWSTLRRLGPSLKPTDVFLIFTPDDPLETMAKKPYQTSKKRAPSIIDDLYGPRFLKKLIERVKNSGSSTSTHPSSPEMWGEAKSHLEKIDAWCREKKVHFWLAYMPWKEELAYQEPAGTRRQFLDFCEEKIDPACLDLTPLFQEDPHPERFYFTLDEHLNVDGHERAAAELMEWMAHK